MSTNGKSRPSAAGEDKSQAVHATQSAEPDIEFLVRGVKEILEQADKDQARLTESYIEAGRRLWQISKALKGQKGGFNRLLIQEHGARRYSTLREYMTLAKAYDAADDAAKVQLAGLFPEGWCAVLNEIRRRKRAKRAANARRPSVQALDAAGKNLEILHGDCMAKLPELLDASVDAVITSPPYYKRIIFPGATTVFGGDRHCRHDWQRTRVVREHYVNRRDAIESGRCAKCDARLVMLGWEDDVREYLQHVVLVFGEVKRVLKPTGVLWVNIGDSYSDGELLFVPHQLALALKADGWICRDEVIWEITNKAPESASDRFYRNHEFLFRFVKQRNYYSDNAAVREPAVWAKPGKGHRFSRRNRVAGTGPGPFSGPSDGMRSLRTVWRIPSEPFGGRHHCAFPKALVERMLLSSCPPGGVCLDPFAGTGTTGLVASAYGRKAILIEANQEYCAVAEERIGTELEPYRAELEERRNRERETALLRPQSEIDVAA